MSKMLRAACASLILMTGTAWADPWKDESGKGRDRGGYDYDDRRGRDHYDDDDGDRRRYYGDDRRYRGDYDRRHHRSAYRVPRGHLPPPGMCRVWLPHRPAGQQPAPTSCRQARYFAERYGGRVVRGERRY